MPTLHLLFAMMVVSAQFRLAGFYTHVSRRMVAPKVSPPRLLALVVGLTGLLSAVLTNDIVCLAMAPVLVEGCARRGLDPVPFLLALACAANVGSAATLIGNPQNILIGQTLRLSFTGYLIDAGVPVLLGLARDLGGDRVPVPRPLAARAARAADRRPALQPLAELQGPGGDGGAGRRVPVRSAPAARVGGAGAAPACCCCRGAWPRAR